MGVLWREEGGWSIYNWYKVVGTACPLFNPTPTLPRGEGVMASVKPPFHCVILGLKILTTV